MLKTTWQLHGNVEFWALAGADPGFLESGVHMYKLYKCMGAGVALLILSNFLINIP